MPGKEKDMIAVWFSLSSKKYAEPLSSFKYLGGLFARSYKAKKNLSVIS